MILNKFLLALMVVGLTPFLLGSAYGGSLSIGVSENSQFLEGTGIDVFTDIPCDGFDPQNLQTGCFDYEIENTFVFYDPNAGAWHKHLQDPNNDCQSPICTLTETITIFSGGPDWNDWHEVLFEPDGATWIDVKVTINPGPGQIVLTDSDDNVVIGDTNTGDDTVWIFFDEPLPVGTVLLIEKTWELSGATPDPFPDHPLGEVTILQFPSVPDDEPPPPPTPPIVGGELLPIDNTALLLAGLQTSAIWMLPVLAGAAGAGFAAFKLRRK